MYPSSRIATTLLIAAVLFLTYGHRGVAFADGSGDNNPRSVRQVPPPGIELSSELKHKLEEELAELDRQVANLKASNKETTRALIPDIEIFSRGVRTVYENKEFFSDKDIEAAFQLLEEGRKRILAINDPFWTRQSGLVVRGHRSDLDHTVQPYGLVIPENYSGNSRLDIWLHGRGERTSEVGFLHQRMNQLGQYAPPNTIVLHPYGRYSNAFKFAGEVDVLESLRDVQEKYSIDPDRISIRGILDGRCRMLAVCSALFRSLVRSQSRRRI